MKNQKTKVTSILTIIIFLVVFIGCSESEKKEANTSSSSKTSTKESKVKNINSDTPLVNDFRGIKWFTKKADIPDLKFEPYDQYTGKKINENNSIGDIPLESISYYFNGKDQLREVELSFDGVHYDKLVSFFTKTMGVDPYQQSEKIIVPEMFGSGSTTVHKSTSVWDLPSINIVIEKSIFANSSGVRGKCNIKPKAEKTRTGGGL